MAQTPSEKTHRIAFQTQTTEINDEGIPVQTWVTERLAWASTEMRSGANKWHGSGYDASVNRLFTINWVPGWEPTPEHRIKYGNQYFRLESVDNIRGENMEMEIRAEWLGSAKGA